MFCWTYSFCLSTDAIPSQTNGNVMGFPNDTRFVSLVVMSFRDPSWWPLYNTKPLSDTLSWHCLQPDLHNILHEPL